MAITIQEAQVLFSSDGLLDVQIASYMASKEMQGLTTKASIASKTVSSIRNSFSGLGSVLATVGVTTGAVKMLQLSADAETTAISFEVLLGSVSRAKKALDDLRALDKKTVFGLPELAAAQKLMLNFGMGADESFTTLSQLTEVAQGNSEQLMLLARAMAQVKAAGRLMGQEANQLINSGFSPLYEISQQTGRSMVSLKADMEAGLISFDMVAKALENLTTGTGRLAGMNERMALTTAGAYSKFKTNIEITAIAIGSALLPELNKVLEAINGTANTLDGVNTTAASFVSTTKAYFQEIQDNLSDLAIAVTVAFSQVPNTRKLVFDDVKTWTSELVAYTKKAGAAIANNLSPSVLLGKGETMALPEFSLSASQARRNERGAVQAELDAARKLRIEERQAAGRKELEQQAKLDAMRQDRPAAPPTELIDVAATAATAAAQAVATVNVQRGGAAEMFRSLQDRIAQQGEADRIAKEQLAIQKQSLDVNKQILGAFSGGLAGVAILG